MFAKYKNFMCACKVYDDHVRLMRQQLPDRVTPFAHDENGWYINTTLDDPLLKEVYLVKFYAEYIRGPQKRGIYEVTMDPDTVGKTAVRIRSRKEAIRGWKVAPDGSCSALVPANKVNAP